MGTEAPLILITVWLLIVPERSPPAVNPPLVAGLASHLLSVLS